MRFEPLPLCLLALLSTAPTLAVDLNPALLSDWPGLPTGWVGEVVARSNIVYAIGSSGAGARVLDITDPTAPRAIGTTQLPLNGSTKFSGNHAYVAAGGSGLLILDVTDPSNPRRISRVGTKGGAADVAVAGSFAYLLETLYSTNGLLHAIDISDPIHPVEVCARPIDANPMALRVSGNHAFVLGSPYSNQGDQWTLDCFDISNPTQAQPVGKVQRAGSLSYNSGYTQMDLSGDYVYVSAVNYDLNYGSAEVIDVHDPTNLQWVTAFKSNRSTSGLTVSGTNLFLIKTSLDIRNGLDILDISNPTTIRRLTTYFGAVSSVAVGGTQAVLANNGRLEVLNISIPASPRRISSWMPPLGVMDLAHAGNLTYTVGPLGLTTYLNILDTSDPVRPQPLGSLSVNGWTQRIKLLGNYAYIVTEQGLHVVDVTDPKAPRRTGGVTPQWAFHDVAFAGDFAFVADQESGLQLLTITNPASPRRLATFLASTTEPVYGVCTTSNLAFVLCQSWQGSYDTWYGKVNILDITNPRNPTTISSYQTVGIVARAAAAGNHLYLTKRYKQDIWAAMGGMLEILDISDPTAPQPMSQYETPSAAFDITVSGGRAYVACTGSGSGPSSDWQTHNGGLSVIDVSDPSHPQRVGGAQRSFLNAISVGGDRAYLGGGFYGTLQILDLSPAAALSRVATVENSDLACGMAGAGNQILLADRLGGIQVIDSTNPANPKSQATIASSEPVWGVAISGHTAYAASGDAGVQSFDLTDPLNPQPLGVYDTPGSARGIALSGQYAYVADGNAGLQILDATSPGNLQSVGSVVTIGFANSVALMGNYALIADWEDGLAIVDVSNPTTPHIVGNYNSGGYTLTVAVAGSNAVLSDGSGGFQIVDLSNPAAPKLLGSAPADGWARHIAVSGRFAYVADAFTGVQVYDISDPNYPRRMGGTSAVDPYTIIPTTNHLFVAGGRDGLAVLSSFTPPLNVTLSPQQTPGNISLRIDGLNGSSVRIQRSPDLIQWQDWQTLTLGEMPLTVSDGIPTGSPQGFYRAVSP